VTFLTNGNVGIGTTAPGAGLDIDKGATNNLALAVRSSGAGWGSGIQFINTASGARTYGFTQVRIVSGILLMLQQVPIEL